MRCVRAFTVLALCTAAAAAGCGGGDREERERAATPTPGATTSPSAERAVISTPGPPELATKNTTRVSSSDTATIAAAVALAVHPSATADARPSAVTLVDAGNWPVAISAAQLVGAGVRAPILFTTEARLPDVTTAALSRLRPGGISRLGGAQIIRVATPAAAPGFREASVEGADPSAVARRIDRLHARATGSPR